MRKFHKFVLIIFVIGLLSLLVNSCSTPEENQEINDSLYYDIAYIGIEDTSNISFIDETGKHLNSVDMEITLPITIFGINIPFMESIVANRFSDVYWGPDGETLGVLYSTRYTNIRYPAMILSNGEKYECSNDEELYTNFAYPIQVLDRERIVINMEEYPYNKLVIYNMKNCEEEGIYYDGIEERVFAISSQGWLAVNEATYGGFALNVYDNNENLVYSDKSVGYEYYIAWSKDGNKLAYSINKENEIDDVCVYDFTEGEKRIVSKSSGKVSFSPDGNKLVMEKIQNHLVILDLVTLQETDLIDGSNPDWRP
ncbi:MAG: PD40 domain-containing protein [Anaerolineaceae bacterium]|nr:PD40 domain-containing protein [Anaerolineaceae bacterium]